MVEDADGADVLACNIGALHEQGDDVARIDVPIFSNTDEDARGVPRAEGGVVARFALKVARAGGAGRRAGAGRRVRAAGTYTFPRSGAPRAAGGGAGAAVRVRQVCGHV